MFEYNCRPTNPVCHCCCAWSYWESRDIFYSDVMTWLQACRKAMKIRQLNKLQTSLFALKVHTRWLKIIMPSKCFHSTSFQKVGWEGRGTSGEQDLKLTEEASRRVAEEAGENKWEETWEELTKLENPAHWCSHWLLINLEASCLKRWPNGTKEHERASVSRQPTVDRAAFFSFSPPKWKKERKCWRREGATPQREADRRRTVDYKLPKISNPRRNIYPPPPTKVKFQDCWEWSCGEEAARPGTWSSFCFSCCALPAHTARSLPPVSRS